MTVQSNTDGRYLKIFLLLYLLLINTTYISYINVPFAIFIFKLSTLVDLNFEGVLIFFYKLKAEQHVQVRAQSTSFI